MTLNMLALSVFMLSHFPIVMLSVVAPKIALLHLYRVVVSWCFFAMWQFNQNLVLLSQRSIFFIMDEFVH